VTGSVLLHDLGPLEVERDGVAVPADEADRARAEGARLDLAGLVGESRTTHATSA
jgi:hypothetical protein